MLVLYSKETISFSSLGIGVLKDLMSSPIITEELNGSYILEFQYSKNGYLSEHIIEQNIIKANNQAFRIWNVKKDLTSITVLAKHIVFDLSFNYLLNVAPSNLNAQDAFNWCLERTLTPNNFRAHGDCTKLQSARYVRKNFTDAIFNEDNALINRFGCELSYDNFDIYCHQKRGQNTNFTIRYKKNLTGIEFNLDFSSTISRLIPVGYDGLLLDETFVESEKINNYFTPLYGTYEFNDIKYDPSGAEGTYSTEEEAKEALRNAARDLLNKGLDVPTISIKIDFVELSKCIEYQEFSNLESVHLGDTVKVIIPELNLNVEARVIKTIYDCLLNRITGLEIGSATPSSVTSQIEMKNEIRKIDTNSIIASVQDTAKSLINHPFKGNLIIDEENGNLYLMDTNSPATAQSVWKWSLGGLGYSSTGINGDYSIAITQDGSIVADFITSGTISTSVIEGLDSVLLNINEILEEGNAKTLKTVNGYKFDKDGISIYTNSSSYNTIINNKGTYYKDGDNVVSQTTKDGTITKDLVMYGTYYYGVEDEFDVENFKKDDAMFIAQLFTDKNGEECVGHFYNR